MKKRRFLIVGVILGLSMSLTASSCSANSYDYSIDYMQKMQEAVAAGDYRQAREYESARNQKIIKLGLDYEATDFFSDGNNEKVAENIAKYIANVAQNNTTQPEYVRYFSDADVVMMAKVMYCEARGIKSKTEIANIGWCILNRVDDGNFGYGISGVILSPNQFAYRRSAPTVNDHGYDLIVLAYDVLENWSKEHSGRTDYVRTLPKQYKWYAGNGVSNRFRCHFRCNHYYQYELGYYYQ